MLVCSRYHLRKSNPLTNHFCAHIQSSLSLTSGSPITLLQIRFSHEYSPCFRTTHRASSFSQEMATFLRRTQKKKPHKPIGFLSRPASPLKSLRIRRRVKSIGNTRDNCGYLDTVRCSEYSIRYTSPFCARMISRRVRILNGLRNVLRSRFPFGLSMSFLNRQGARVRVFRSPRQDLVSPQIPRSRRLHPLATFTLPAYHTPKPFLLILNFSSLMAIGRSTIRSPFPCTHLMRLRTIFYATFPNEDR